MSKYHNIKTHGFDSRAEYARWLELKLLEKAGKIRDLQKQVPFPLEVNGALICTYIADFTYITVPQERYVVEDVKGVRTAIYRLKKKLMKALEDVDIKEVSAKDLRIRVSR